MFVVEGLEFHSLRQLLLRLLICLSNTDIHYVIAHHTLTRAALTDDVPPTLVPHVEPCDCAFLPGFVHAITSCFIVTSIWVLVDGCHLRH